jgi:DMSO/TMAO reductase YedYZ molybdopterin-dependent catalytic subunit
VIAARCLVVAVLISFVAGPLFAADERNPAYSASATPSLTLEGKLKHPQSLSFEALRRLPAEQVQVSFQSDRGMTTASYTGVSLWAVLMAAGGIADDEKSAELRHVVKIIARDGYMVVISTGEIAPDFGGKPALIAYQREGEPAGESGLRLVMPGDKRGGRNVRDVTAIRVE